MSALVTRALMNGLRAALWPEAARFNRALHRPRAAQEQLLRRLLRQVGGSQQAAAIAGFDRIASFREFQDAVPIRTPDDYAPLIEAQKQGAPAVLSREPLLRFERSGGSSGPSKYLPYTRTLLSEFHRALAPWLHDLLAHRPALRRGPSYWSISPLAGAAAGTTTSAARTTPAGPERTAAGIPVGSADDVSYFPRALQPLLAQVFPVPSAVARLPDVDSCRYVTLRLLLACPQLAFISVWNPSFLTLLLQAFDQQADRLLDDLATGACRPPALAGPHQAQIAAVLAGLPLRPQPDRARQLRLALARGPLSLPTLWPGLDLVSTWTDAQASRLLPALQTRLGDVQVQGKGLLATEGVVSLPVLGAPAPVLAVRSHVLEFLDPERPGDRPRLVDQLEPGREYEVLLSTGAGLLRYRIGDRVRVSGQVAATPCVAFVGRADRVSDLVGEKLSARWVSRLLDGLRARAPAADRIRFVLVAPEWTTPPAYQLFVEADAPDATVAGWATALEQELSAGHHYRYARQLGQLGPVRAVRVHQGARRYEQRCLAAGQRAGDIKPIDLSPETGWLGYFQDAHRQEQIQ